MSASPKFPVPHDFPNWTGDVLAYRQALAAWCADPNRCSSTVGVLPEAPAPAAAQPWPGPWDVARQDWDRVYADHHRILRSGRVVPGTAGMPELFDGETLRRLTATLLSPQHRPLLRSLLLGVLGDDIADISLAVAREVLSGK